MMYKSFPTLIQNKKVLLIVGIIILLIVGILTLMLLAPSTKTSRIHSSQTDLPSAHENTFPTFAPHTRKTMINAPAKPTSIQTYVPGWILSDNDVYTFQYPSDWRLERTLFNGGQTVMIRPNNFTDESNQPHWSITITKTNPSAPIIANEDFYIKNGFQRSRVYISGKPAIKVSGILFPNKVNIYEAHIFLQQQQYSYYIIYKYPHVPSQYSYEALFQKITDTVHIE